jgi:hypothetical protein
LLLLQAMTRRTAAWPVLLALLVLPVLALI